jgi:hypothetical protein
VRASRNQLVEQYIGTAIYYFGDIDLNDHGKASITLDAQSTIITSNSSGGYLGQALLFSMTGLANTTHTFVVEDIDNGGLYTTVDRIMSVFV